MGEATRVKQKTRASETEMMIPKTQKLLMKAMYGRCGRETWHE